MRPPARLLLGGLAVVPLLAVAAALYTQYRMDMMPCAWCVLQRLFFVGVALAGLLGLLVPGLLLRRLAAGLALLAALAGITAALWQHFVANDSASCGMSLADRLMGYTGMDSRFPEVFAAYASCADAKVNLFGVPYEFWSLSLFIALALAALQVVARPR